MGQLRTGTVTTRLELGAERPGLRLGFTLVELIVVMAIIGIILAFLLIAAGDARRRAEQDATLALITKLEGGINDRLDALLQTRPDPNLAHLYVAGIYPTGSTTPMSQASTRAQVFAWYDYIKSELPDVFFVQNTTGPYPLNFAANAYPGAPIDSGGFSLGNYALPLGNGVVGGLPAGYGVGNLAQPMGTGIFGASYFAAAGLYKNLGYLPAGYDGIDNDGNGYIDDWNEGVNDPPGYTSPDAKALALVQGNLNAHQHNTARSETLYAILVEGVGPLGSVFSREDFSDREVMDTDHDGLPEFVDAWGQPLQFFRWPLLYHTDTQRGQVIDYWDYTQTPPVSQAVELFNPPYRSVFEGREQDPLDPNQQLMAPAWWSSSQNGNPHWLHRYRRVGRRQRRGAGLRVLLPPAHRAFSEYRQLAVLLGPGKPGLPTRHPRLPQGLLLQTADSLFGARPATGNLPTAPERPVPEPDHDDCLRPNLLRKQRHSVRSSPVQRRDHPRRDNGAGGLDDLPASRERP